MLLVVRMEVRSVMLPTGFDEHPDDDSEEPARGDAEAAAKRIASLDGIPVLLVSAEASEFVDRLLATTILPAKAAIDALHIAVAVLSGMDYLLTWNCTHIANAAIRGRIE